MDRKEMETRLSIQFTCSVDLDNDDDGELAKKYGVRTATINLWKRDADMQWSIWHEHCDPSSSCSDGFETLCEPFCICCECGVILFARDVK